VILCLRKVMDGARPAKDGLEGPVAIPWRPNAWSQWAFHRDYRGEEGERIACGKYSVEDRGGKGDEEVGEESPVRSTRLIGVTANPEWWMVH
jgi:hypothetical protein